MEEVLTSIDQRATDKVGPQLRQIAAVGHNFLNEHIEADDNPSIVGSAAWKAAVADCATGCTCARHEPGALD